MLFLSSCSPFCYMKKLITLIVLSTLFLSSCSSVSLSKENGVSSGQVCKTSGLFTENKGIEYICWESYDGNLFWRQNQEVETEYLNESEVSLNRYMERKYCLESLILEKNKSGSPGIFRCPN